MTSLTSKRHGRLTGSLTIVATIALVATMGVAQPAAAADEAVIDLGDTQQVVRGFGGMTHAAWIGDLTPTQRDTAFDNGADDLGLSVLRIPVPESRAEFSRDLATAKAAYDKGVTVFASPWNPPAEFTETFEMEPPAVGSKYEAEEGTLVSATVSTDQPGFEGAGYVEFGDASGASVQFDAVTIGSAGTKNLAFRYALAEGSRTVDLYLNGTLAVADITFTATGSASTWARKHVQLPMTPGQNVVRLETTGSGGPSLDNVQASAYVAPGEAKRLRHDRYAEYAAYLDEYVTYLRDNGVELYAISIQNEPDYAHEWTWWTPGEIVTFLRDHADAISTRVMAPESFQYRKDMTDPILNDPEALANTDIIGAHLYGTAVEDFPYPLFEEKGAGKELWMTEVYVPNSSSSANLWPEALEVAEHIHHAMVDGQFQAYVWWYIRRSYSPMLDDGSISKRGYSMAHFSKFVRPGDVRVGASPSPQEGVVTSAYLRDDGTATVVAVNTGETAVEQDFSFSGASIGDVSSWVTDATRGLAEQPVIGASGDRFTASLPAQSVTTFVTQADAGSGIPIEATVDTEAPGSLTLSVADYGESLDIGVAENLGDRLRASGDLPGVTVTDSRNAAQAANGGWTVTGRSSGFDGPVAVGPENVGWVPRVIDPSSSISVGEPKETALSGGEGLAEPATLGRAAAENRRGSTALSADVALDLPVDSPAGTYRGTLTLTLFPVD